MPSIDSFALSSHTIPCGTLVTIDISATFKTAKGGFVTIRAAGDNQCYFGFTDKALSDRVTLRIPQKTASIQTRQRLKCHESGDTAFDIVATAEDDSGTSSPRRRAVLVTTC